MLSSLNHLKAFWSNWRRQLFCYRRPETSQGYHMIVERAAPYYLSSVTEQRAVKPGKVNKPAAYCLLVALKNASVKHLYIVDILKTKSMRII